VFVLGYPARLAIRGPLGARLCLRRLQLGPHQHELQQLLDLRRAMLLALLTAARLAARKLLPQRHHLLLQRTRAELQLVTPHRLELYLTELLLEQAHLLGELVDCRCGCFRFHHL